MSRRRWRSSTGETFAAARAADIELLVDLFPPNAAKP